MFNYKNIEFKEMHKDIDLILDVGFYNNSRWCKVSSIAYMDGDSPWYSCNSKKVVKFYYHEYHRHVGILSSELDNICVCYNIELNHIVPYIGCIYINHNYRSFFEFCIDEAMRKFVNV